jgi:hypothetical protein
MNRMEAINNLLQAMPENQLPEVLDFLMFLKIRSDKAAIQDIEAASLSSMSFWDNPDDEIWNHV